jgi:hypothetical protein
MSDPTREELEERAKNGNSFAAYALKLLAERDEARKELGEARGILKVAQRFIRNGIQLGFIRMPDPDLDDPAHDALPIIEAFLSRFETLEAKG